MDGKRACIFDDHDRDCIPLLHAKLIDHLYLLDISSQKHASLIIPELNKYAKYINSMKVASAWDEDVAAKSLALSVGHLYSEHTVAETGPALHTASAAPAVSAVSQTATAAIWHGRLGHPSKTTCKQLTDLSSTHLPGYDTLSCVYELPCLHCLQGSFPASTHYPSSNKAENPGDLVLCDLTGPYKEGHGGARFTMNLVDHCTGYAYTVPIKSKDEVIDKLPVALDRLQQLCGNKVKHLRTDKGTEFFNEQVHAMLGERCVTFTHSVPYTPQQNGAVERLNRSLMEICRSLLGHSKRSLYLWPLAYQTACYLFNRRVSASRSSVTRFEAFTGTAPSLAHLKVFGCKCFVKIPNPLLTSKLQSRAVAAIFVGYDEYSVGYKVLVNNVVYIRNDVVFSETEFAQTAHASTDFTDDVPTTQSVLDVQDDYDEFDTAQPTDTVPTDPAQHAQGPTGGRKRKRQQQQVPIKSPAAHTRSKHTVNIVFTPPVFSYDGSATPAACNVVTVDNPPHPAPTSTTHAAPPARPLVEQEPSSYLPPFPEYSPGTPLPVPETLRQAQASELWPHWHRAVIDEYNSLKDMHVFQLVDLPVGEKAMSSKWVFTFKHDAHIITKAKARLVARGFEQRENIDYDELFSPTVSQSSLRILMAYAAINSCYIHQLDIKTAFLNGLLDRCIYLQQPAGCDDGSGRVWLLLKSLYGLKQAPRAWYQRLRAELGKIEFIPSEEDSALFYKWEGDHKIFICVHVDDMLVIHKDKQIVLDTVEKIKKMFTVTDLGQVSNYLKINVVQLSDHGIMLHQSDYIQSILNKFWDKSKLTPSQHFATTPLPYDFKFVKFQSVYGTDDDWVKCDPTIYRQIVGSLMYLSVFTRPDISYCINQLCRYMQTPSLAHYKATQYVMRYLNATHDYGILYKSTASSALVGYCDASHNSCSDTARSCTGHCFSVGDTLVAWQSHMQHTVAHSTAESEYMSINNSGREGVWLQRLHREVFGDRHAAQPLPIMVGEILPSQPQPSSSQSQLIMNDNVSAIKMVNSDHSSKLTKHISKQHHWARERVSEGVLSFEHIEGVNNTADILTKFLPAPVFEKHRARMGVVSLKDVLNAKK